MSQRIIKGKHVPPYIQSPLPRGTEDGTCSSSEIRKYIVKGLSTKLASYNYSLTLFEHSVGICKYNYKIPLGTQCLLNLSSSSDTEYFIGINIMSGETIDIELARCDKYSQNPEKIEGAKLGTIISSNGGGLDRAINRSFEDIKKIINIFFDLLITNINQARHNILTSAASQAPALPVALAAAQAPALPPAIIQVPVIPVSAPTANSVSGVKRKASGDKDDSNKVPKN